VKLERRDVDNGNDRKVDAKVVPLRLQDQASNFSAALQRQRPVAHERESKPAHESKSRRPPPNSAATADVVSTSAPGESKPLFAEGAPLPLLSLLSSLGGGCEHPDPSAAMPRPTRHRRALADPESSHCIEVAHPRTGMKFMLSQKDGVWLLSVDERSSMDPAELQPFLTYLREQFAERGLGPVDLV